MTRPSSQGRWEHVRVGHLGISLRAIVIDIARLYSCLIHTLASIDHLSKVTPPVSVAPCTVSAVVSEPMWPQNLWWGRERGASR